MIEHHDDEAAAATELLSGKVVRRISRPSSGQVAVEFTDATRLFVHVDDEKLELSITDGPE